MEDTEARQLAAAAQSGDEQARNELVEAYLPACKRMAGLWQHHAFRAGMHSVTFEDLYSDAYTALLGPIIENYDVNGIPFLQWVNLQLRGRLSNSINTAAISEEREIVTDLDDLGGIPAAPDENESKDDLPKLLLASLELKVISSIQMQLLTLISQGLSARQAAHAYCLSPRWGQELVATAKESIRREVLGIVD